MRASRAKGSNVHAADAGGRWAVGWARRGAWRRLHTCAGVGAAAVLLFTASTGVLLSLWEIFEVPAPPVPAEARHPALQPTELVQRAEAHGGGAVRILELPSSPEAPVRAELSNHRELWLAPNGTVLEVRALRTPVRRLMTLVFLIHTGTLLGMPGELLMVGVGLALVTSVASGLLIWPWWVRRRRKSG